MDKVEKNVYMTLMYGAKVDKIYTKGFIDKKQDGCALA